MHGVDIGASSADNVSSGQGVKSGFSHLLSDVAKGHVPIAVRSTEANPGLPRPPSNTAKGRAMPDDEEFLVVDDISVETAADGDEVVVVSGETVTAEDADAIAATGDSVVVPLSRFTSRPISGSLFASMLLDQRSGLLPNPFSLMRISGPAAIDGPTAPVQTTPSSTAVARIDDTGEVPPTLSDTAEADAIAEGKEMSRLEARISVLFEKLESMLKALRILVGSTAKEQGETPRR